MAIKLKFYITTEKVNFEMSQWRIKSSNFAVMRTPYLPAEAFNLSPDVHDGFEEKQIKTGLSTLIELVKNQDIVQAIEFASPSLAEKVGDLTTELSVDNLKLASSIYKYVTRMSMRSTPFGAFSGVMTVRVDEHTQIDAALNMRLFLRLDNRCLEQVIKYAERISLTTRNMKLQVRKNNSLYQIGNEFRFVSHTIKNSIGDYKLDEVKVNQAIGQALDISSQWISVNQLANKLKIMYPDAGMPELTDFVFDLLENQLLESNLNVVVSSDNSLREFISRAKTSAVDTGIITVCEQVLDALNSIDSINQRDLVKKLDQVKQLLSDLLPKTELKHWLHVDSFRSNDQAVLGRDKLTPVINSLQMLAPLMWKSSKPLIDFKARFQKIYGDDAEVPLLEALDVDNGVGFGQKRGGRSPLLEGMIAGRKGFSRQIKWHDFDQFLLNKITESISHGNQILSLKFDDVKQFGATYEAPSSTFNSSVAVHGTFIQDGNGENPLFHLKGVAGPSSLLYLGRFCCGDKKMASECKKLADIEQQNDTGVIYAEVVHVSQAITANISCRPALREYEIVYGPCDSSLKTERQITCDDLYIKIEAGQLAMFSRRLNKQVKPRLASAHNTTGMNLPVYQFLHAMQGAEGWFTNISMNSAINSLSYLPEIRIGDLIISQRRWLISLDDLQSLKKCADNQEKFNWVKNTLKERNMVTSIAIKEGDNILEFDLSNSMGVLFFANELIRRNGTVELVEGMKNRLDQAISFEGQKFHHEVVFPVFVDAGIERKKARFIHGDAHIESIKKAISLPGEKWKYLKIYTGEATADKLLAAHLAPLANQLIADGGIESWHFIRYQDPDFHIRIRFKLKADNHVNQINKILNPQLRLLFQQGLIQEVVEGSYFPEIKRYGGREIIATCEKLFYLNSMITCEVIGHTFNHPNKDQLRWQWSLRLAWQLVMSSTESLASMEQFYKSVSASYDSEFGLNPVTKKKLSDNYRSTMPAVAESLSLDFDAALNPVINCRILPQYQQTLSELKQLCQQHNKDLNNIIQSLVHMDCNRMFVINPRANEWILYQYMARYSRTVIARKFTPGVDFFEGLTGFKEQEKPPIKAAQAG